MRIKFILPALTEANSDNWRPIKYSLFPPLGLATLASFLREDDEAEICDEHVELLSIDDEPDLVAIEVYVTSARRSFAIADSYRRRGVPVVMGGLHVTACPEEALAHADTIVLGPAEEAWPRFLDDFRRGYAQKIYQSTRRDIAELPPMRRDLINSRNYLVPNSLVVSRGCPHNCDFCYTDSFFQQGKRFYTCSVEWALGEIERMPGRHLFFLDDNIFADRRFSSSLFHGMRGMGRIWQGAATVRSILDTELLDVAVEAGLRSLFVGFESLSQDAMLWHGKGHNLVSQYEEAIKALHDRGVMINASFVYGMEEDDETVFDTTVDWAIAMGLETTTFHILTPYPGTGLYQSLEAQGRILNRDWDRYDTRHAVFAHPKMSTQTLEAGYWRSYKRFYKWSNIARAARTKDRSLASLRHLLYVAGWKKCDPIWSAIIKLRQLDLALPSLERVLNGGDHGERQPRRGPATATRRHRKKIILGRTNT
ncbi:MAG: radical SAM protein [Gaiellales bacterium]|nr:MAG: radical SAM protein [Gaiellales bacterium]